MAKSFYVYQLLDPRTLTEEFPEGVPFYVGKGSGRRSSSHLRWSHRYSTKKTAKIDTIRRAGFEPLVQHVAEGLTEDAAFDLEVALIAQLGRHGIDDGGILTNRLPGGSGVNFDWTGRKHSEETLERMRGREVSQATRDLISARNKGKAKSKTHRENLSKARTGWKDSQATRDQKRRSHTGLKHAPSHAQAISEGLRGHVVSMDTKERIRSKLARTYWVTDPEGNTHSVNNLRQWAPANGASYQCLLKVAAGTLTEWRGWQCTASAECPHPH